MPDRSMMVDADQIKDQAQRIRDIMDSVIDACNRQGPLDTYARNKLLGGTIGGDVTTLCIMLALHSKAD